MSFMDDPNTLELEPHIVEKLKEKTKHLLDKCEEVEDCFKEFEVDGVFYDVNYGCYGTEKFVTAYATKPDYEEPEKYRETVWEKFHTLFCEDLGYDYGN
jgi:hypothetical protein